ncbi:MAG: EAL domain-containing protein [Lachnospiraceae bacterium]|jgi:EAL domain-containing protein (putative c-di-GMP-specific phosphodiesterase class I)|nr:EAL domain-containing protein [Lachnospiraceae bacterium]
MLNIVLQSCAMVMLFVVFLIFVKEKSLDLYSRRRYFWTLLSGILCLSLDIASIFGIYGATVGTFPVVGTQLICKLYVVSLAFQSYQGFLYAAGEFFAENSHKLLKRLYQIWFCLGAVAIMALPIRYIMWGRVVYSYGPSTEATYIVTVVFIISTIVMAFRGTEQASERRRWAILLWQGCWLAAALIQLFNKELLLVGFASAFGMVLIYAELENPHEGIDRASGLFTSNALLDYVNDAYQHRRSFEAVHIYLYAQTGSFDPDVKKRILVQTANYFYSRKSMYVFRNTENEILVLFHGRRLETAEIRSLVKGLAEVIAFPVSLHTLVVPDSAAFSSAEEFLRLPTYFARELEAKEEVVVDEAAMEGFREYGKIKEMIQSALTENRVEVFYQPFYNVQTGKFTSAEALVRIRDKEGPIIPPGKFIPIAEENGLIVPLGIEIFRQVCEFLATGKPKDLGITHIEVNLSIAQFDDENPSAFVREIMEQYQVDPKMINLEITETVSQNTKKKILKNMEKLINAGINFSLDDFGTGRSNLDYFLEMPVQVIKFDYSFTQGYFKSEKAKLVIENMIELMHSMGMAIVSEGVETKEQFETMCGLGVEYIQGFYFSKPLPKDEFIAFLEKHRAEE